jgi:hypothetical protein
VDYSRLYWKFVIWVLASTWLASSVVGWVVFIPAILALWSTLVYFNHLDRRG